MSDLILQACGYSALPGLMAFLIAALGFVGLAYTLRLMKHERRALDAATRLLYDQQASSLRQMREELHAIARLQPRLPQDTPELRRARGS